MREYIRIILIIACVFGIRCAVGALLEGSDLMLPESLMTELLKIKIGILICFVLLLIICSVYVIEKVKGE